MIQGLYSVIFKSNGQNSGSGVAVLVNGQVLGGDAGFSYVGKYSLTNGIVTASAEIARFNPAYESVFPGVYNYVLNVSGKSADDHFELRGSPAGRGELQLAIEFRLISRISV